MSVAIQVGSVGATIELTIKDQAGVVIDLSAATLTNALYMRAPGNRLLVRTPSLLTDGTDGIVYYDTIAGDIVQFSAWQVQFKSVIGGISLPSEVVTMQVLANVFP